MGGHDYREGCTFSDCSLELSYKLVYGKGCTCTILLYWQNMRKIGNRCSFDYIGISAEDMQWKWLNTWSSPAVYILGKPEQRTGARTSWLPLVMSSKSLPRAFQYLDRQCHLSSEHEGLPCGAWIWALRASRGDPHVDLMVSWMIAETISLGTVSVRRMSSDEIVQFSKIRQIARNGLIVKNQ